MCMCALLGRLPVRLVVSLSSSSMLNLKVVLVCCFHMIFSTLRSSNENAKDGLWNSSLGRLLQI